MKTIFAAMALLVGSATAQAQQVDVGTGDWTQLPTARNLRSMTISEAAMQRVEAIGRRRTCAVPGLGPRRISLSVPFTIRFDEERRAQRIVLRDLGCPELETVLGRVVQGMAARGAYAPSGGPGWYRNALEFTIE